MGVEDYGKQRKKKIAALGSLERMAADRRAGYLLARS